ncbi:MAG: adenosine kinase [Alphaproteobacteria bacterium]
MMKQDTTYDVLAIGNAIVDVLTRVGDQFLVEHGINKAVMNICDTEKSNYLFKCIVPEHECSGGSAASTVIGIASLGGTPAFIGKIRDDKCGKVFKRDIGTSGVDFFTKSLFDGPNTGKCIILVTPDEQSTQVTYPGACTLLSEDDIDPDIIGLAKILYLESYLLDYDSPKKAFKLACDIAKDKGCQIAISLSDKSCVDRNRKDLIDIIGNYADIVFATDAEIMNFYQTDNLDKALNDAKNHTKITAITRKNKGSIVVSDKIKVYAEAEVVTDLVDITGAGDLYVAGFLYGYAYGKDLATCARIGSITAAEVITHYGSRPEVSLRSFVRKYMV